MNGRRRTVALVVLLVLAGCGGGARRAGPPPAAVPARPEAPPAPPPVAHPGTAELLALPDAVPRPEPCAALGNPPFYAVYGLRYTVLTDSRGFTERGVASWYGPDFHGAATSIGEPYDMYTMTAAHRTLPLPAYARVTNLRNGRSVVVRINDRGPFKADRIIDLSYAAALRLDIIRDGTAPVEVTALEPACAPPPSPRTTELYAQAGAFAIEANARRLRERLLADGIDNVAVRAETAAPRPVYRVRIGPLPTVAAFDALLARLRALGISGVTLAPN